MIVLTVALGALAGAAGVAYATIPDSGGVIHACYHKPTGFLLRLYDSETGSPKGCGTKESAVNWYAEGGADGAFVNAVIAGAGLAGGGTSGDVTLSIADGGLAGGKLADNGVTARALAPNSVGMRNIIAMNLTEDAFADDAVTSRVLAPNSVGTSNVISMNLTEDVFANDAVTSRVLAPNSVGMRNVIEMNLTEDAFANDAVTSRVLAPNSVGMRNVIEMNLTEDAFASGAVTNRVLAPNSVGRSNLIQMNVTSDKLSPLGSNDGDVLTSLGGEVVWQPPAVSSDRNAKTRFARVDVFDVLDRLLGIPMQSWAYKARPAIRHIGPTAQDFRAAFGIGEDDRRISVVDAEGVALASIQGLYMLARGQQGQIAALRAANALLAERLARLEHAATRGQR